MSNIKEIDGVFVNLDFEKIKSIRPYEHSEFNRDGGTTFLGYLINIKYFNEEEEQTDVLYRTVEEAEDRIREILKKQNSEDIKI